MPEERAANQQQMKVEYVAPERGLPSVYANNIAISPSNNDIRLIFGQLTEVSPEKAVINTKVEIITTWLEAKILASFLQAHVDAFEKKNGPIIFPAMPDAPTPKSPFANIPTEAMHVTETDAIKRKPND
jgi:Protein of unknown function (DUF3467)